MSNLPLILIVLVTMCLKSTTANDSTKTDYMAVNVYRALLKQKREEQLQAISQMLKISSSDKQRSVIELMLPQIFKVLSDSQVKLMETGYHPGDPFPSDKEPREVLTLVAENTAFLGDLVLKLPEITQAVLGKDPRWVLLTRWAVGFMNDTNLYAAREKKLLNLMAQELEIIPREVDFVNPYKGEAAKLDKLADDFIRDATSNSKKQEKKKGKKPRGPRLSGPRVEL